MEFSFWPPILRERKFRHDLSESWTSTSDCHLNQTGLWTFSWSGKTQWISKLMLMKLMQILKALTKLISSTLIIVKQQVSDDRQKCFNQALVLPTTSSCTLVLLTFAAKLFKRWFFLNELFLFLTDEIQYHDGLRSRELGQAPILLCGPNS